MVVIVAQRRVNLRQRQMRMLAVDFLRAPAIGHVIERDLDHLHPRAINPCQASGIPKNMGDGLGSVHGWKVRKTSHGVKTRFLGGSDPFFGLH